MSARAPHSPRDRVQELVFLYLERTSAGESSSKVLNELLEREPEQRDALQRALGALGGAGLLPEVASEPVPQRLGEFRVERRLGSGGMGVVVLATQESLGRLVALKIVRGDQLFVEGARARFHREVESAARLAHPGIAQVYSAGVADGIPYFAQEFVRGASLEALLRELPRRAARGLRGADMGAALLAAMSSAGDAFEGGIEAELFTGSWVDACLGIARQVAQALQHAHERGVLHRDVKPSNVLLTPAGRAVLVDFGLASVAGADRLTRSGSHVGSLAYTAPELLVEPLPDAQREHGSRADLYSLGVTLYELLTLELPFHAASLERVLARIALGHPKPPRRLNADVSRDAETVCLCAMDHDARRRYASAGELALDLASVLARRPIRVRPASGPRRLVRWAQRRPAAATALALAISIVVGGPLAFAVQRARVADELRELNEDLAASLASEAEASARAERHYGIALDAVDSALRQLGDESLKDVPRLQQVRLDVLDRAQAAFDALQAERPDDRALHERRTRLRGTRGEVLLELGRSREALEELDEYLALFLELEAGGRTDVFDEVVRGLLEKASALYARGLHADAAELQRRTAARFEALEAAGRLDDELLPAYSATLTGLASAERLMKQFDAAREHSRRAIELGEAAAARFPDHVHSHRCAGAARAHVGQVEFDAGDPGLALEHYSGALEHFERALELDPNDRIARFDRARTFARMGRAYFDVRDAEQAQIHLSRGLELLEALIDDYPQFSGSDDEWLTCKDHLSQLCVARGEWVRGRALLEEVALARERAAGADPDSPYEVSTAASAFANWSNVLCNSTDLVAPERYQESLAITERGIELLESALALAPPTDHVRLIATFLHYQHAVALARVGRPEEAMEAIGAMEEFQGAGAMPPVYLAEAWAEWQAAELIRDPQARTSAAVEEAFERGLEHLRAALDQGSLDPAAIDVQESFDAWRSAPRFAAIVDEARERRAAR